MEPNPVENIVQGIGSDTAAAVAPKDEMNTFCNLVLVVTFNLLVVHILERLFTDKGLFDFSKCPFLKFFVGEPKKTKRKAGTAGKSRLRGSRRFGRRPLNRRCYAKLVADAGREVGRKEVEKTSDDEDVTKDFDFGNDTEDEIELTTDSCESDSETDTAESDEETVSEQTRKGIPIAECPNKTCKCTCSKDLLGPSYASFGEFIYAALQPYFPKKASITNSDDPLIRDCTIM